MPVERRTIQIRLLGPLDVRDRQRRETRAVLTQPRRLALLAYLAVAPPTDFHRRATLLATFWPEHDEIRGRNALRQALHFLRTALGPDTLESRGAEEVRLHPATCWCDVRAFDAAVAAGRLDTAVELYRGDLLDGFYIAGGEEFEPWLERQRSRLQRAHVAALEAMAIEREEQGDHAGAACYWHRLAEHAPENGRVMLRLMQAVAHTGDRAEALRLAERHRARLQHEFGADLDPAIVTMTELLRRPE